MNKLSMEKKVAVISALVEGCSVRSTSRLTGVAKGTILRLLAEVGTACDRYQDATLRNIPAKRIQVDEIWSFVGCKEKNVTAAIAATRVAGSVWTFVAIEAQTKLVLGWQVGRRDAGFATEFLRDVAARVTNRVQLSTDGHKMYLAAVDDSFGGLSIMRNWLKFTAMILMARGRTAPHNVEAQFHKRSPATQILSTFRPATLNGRTSRCA